MFAGIFIKSLIELTIFCILIFFICHVLSFIFRTENIVLKLKHFHSQFGMKWAYLTLILLISLTLGLINLEKVPLGLYADQASVGFNAYCIAETGKDEYGEKFPLFFTAFGEYKNPVLIYFTAIVIKIFGPSIFSLRLSSCLLCLIAIFFTYKLADLYFGKSIALFSAFLLTLSPWLIQYSRYGTDAVALPPFFIMSLYFFSLGLKSDSRYIILSSIPISISFYTYAVAKAFVPIFYLFFLLVNLEKILEKKRQVVNCVFLMILMLIPMMKTSLEKNINSRSYMLSILNEDFSLKPARRDFENLKLHFLTEHKLLLLTTIFIRNYFKHMSTNFLLKNGDGNIRHHVGERGQILRFTFWMLIAGFFYLIFKKQKELLVFPIWFLLFPVPASLTWESLPHAGRAICGLGSFEILAAVGFSYLISRIKKLLSIYKGLGIISIVLTLVIVLRGVNDFKNYLMQYFTKYPLTSTYAFDYHIYAVARTTEKMKDYDLFILPFSFYNIHFLYLGKVDPKKWLSDTSILKYVSYNVNQEIFNIPEKRIARIVRPGNYSFEETIAIVYHDITKEPLYEIKKVRASSKKSLRDRNSFSPTELEGLRGKYYNGINFDELRMTRIDNGLNFNWEWGSPGGLIDNDNFSVKWNGWIFAKQSGNYRFFTINDNGVRVFIDGNTIIEDWDDHIPATNEGSTFLDSGWHSISIEYFEASGTSTISLEWQQPDGKRSVIQSDLLSPDPIYY